RRRHTRLVSDWSSDVCSSDLGRERLVDLEALHVAQLPSGTRERLLDCWNRTKAEHAGRNGGDAVGDEARHGLHGPGICESAVGDEHGGGGAVEARRIAGSDGPAFTEGRTQLGGTLKRFVGPPRLVRPECLDPRSAPDLNRDDLLNKLARISRVAETLL